MSSGSFAQAYRESAMETINEIIAAVEEPPESFEQYLTSYADRVGDLVNSFIPKGTHADMDRYLYQPRSEEHTSELQSRPHISYAVFCLKKKFF